MENCNSNITFHGEAFLLKTVSNDGYSVIIGGICPEGKKQESIQAYSKMSKVKIGHLKDEFLIDYILAKNITLLSPKWIHAVGASIYIHDVQKRTGGIIGNPFAEYESAQGNIEEISTGLFLISLPGGPGIAFSGNYKDAVILEKIVCKKNITQDRKIEAILEKINEITALYILVTDGSGEDSSGRIFISDKNGKKFEKFR